MHMSRYRHIKETMVANTIGFESRFLNAESLRLIVFIGTAKPAPNAVRWLHRQWIRVTSVNGPTYKLQPNLSTVLNGCRLGSPKPSV
ncbi:hypothetical protein DPMN_034417 [Dreissena polymorpha]|uniref:Uncharacterized protein n=1 Tax=Dreissena polymorpha TaxID=45954 RepID=A0A9D4M6U8_DREPO|nr:hypothetical protein DPMN_034417 [Dreissena polymorpha]